MTTEAMRLVLEVFCDEHESCSVCPLASPVCRCGCGTHFCNKKHGKYEMTDDEITAAYAVAFQVDKSNLDAVEVVRCVDCAKGRKSAKDTRLHFVWCEKWDNIMRYCDFCSFGERKGND